MRIQFVVSFLIALVAVATESRAADRFWVNHFGGTFIDPFNWQDGFVPGQDDIAHFGLTTNPALLQRVYAVVFTVNAFSQAINIEDDFVTFDLAGTTFRTMLISGNEIGSVAGRLGRLTLINGTMQVAGSSDLFIGSREGASGSLTVSTGGRLRGRPGVVIGRLGPGALRIENGGFVDGGATFIGNAAGVTGAATVTGDESSWSTFSFMLVGPIGNGTLDITDGGSVSNTVGSVARDVGSSGGVTVSGFNSTWANFESLSVGLSGQASMNITDGGRVFNTDGFIGVLPGGTGFGTVDGALSQWIQSGDLTVGDSGVGTLNIAAGGWVQNVIGSIGGPGGSGAVAVDGADSLWTNSSFLTVGNKGRGTLAITNGGEVHSVLQSVVAAGGTKSAGDVTVDGADSQWVVFGDLLVGLIGQGTLTIIDGGRVQNTDGVVGSNTEGIGVVTVSGADSQWISTDELTVGNAGPGTLNITAGGWVQNADGVIARFPSGTGIVTVEDAGSTWTMTGGLSVGGRADTGADGGSGTLTIGQGGTVSAGQGVVLFPDGLLRLEGGTLDTAAIRFQGGGQFQWTAGTLTVDVYHADLTNPDGGVLAPGRSAGSTTITGSYTQQAGAKLEIEIGGLSGGVTHDLVDITGGAFLGGELQLAMLNGFVPAPGNAFTVLNAAGGISGVFTNVTNGQRLVTVDGIGSFLVHYGPGSAFAENRIILTGFAFTPGDCDHDGHVDLDDYAPFPDCLGGPGVPYDPTECECIDLNPDNDVDLRDFADLQAGFTGP